jgi:hypothetical protein
VTRTRVRAEQIAPGALEGLRRLTAVDRALYDEAVRLFEDSAAEGSAPAGIPDAPLLSDLSFDRPIRGSGWLGRERAGDEPYACWIGHTATARVELADDRRARFLVVEVPHVVEPAILETLRIEVDGRELAPSFAESGGAVVAIAPLERRRRKSPVAVQLSVDHATRPCDIDPDNPDSRQLGIAVRRIALARRPPA